jgi:hypothetical protein
LRQGSARWLRSYQASRLFWKRATFMAVQN